MRFLCSFSVQSIAFLVACCITTACYAGGADSGFVTSLSSLMLGQSGGTYDAAQATISVDGDTSDWDGLASATLTHQEINDKSDVNGINISIRYAWDSDNLYVLVEELTEDETPAEGASPNSWALGPDAPWGSDSVGFYDAPANWAQAAGPGPGGATGPVTQPWVGFSSDGQKRHLGRNRPEDQGTTFLIPGQSGFSVNADGTRVVEFYHPWSDLLFDTSVVDVGHTFRFDPLLVDGIDGSSFNGQSFPGGETGPANVAVEDTSFVRLAEGEVGPVQTGGTFDAVQASIAVDGDPSDWDGLESATLIHQEINDKSAVNGINVAIRYAWDDANLYVLVEELTVDETPAEGASPNSWALGPDAPWGSDSVGFYDAPANAAQAAGPGPGGATGPVTQPWVGFSSDGQKRHLGRNRPEDQGTTFLIPGQSGFSVNADGTRVVEFYHPWSDLLFDTSVVDVGHTFRFDPLLVDGIDGSSFNGQSFPGGETGPANVAVEDTSFVRLAEGDVSPALVFRRGDCDQSGKLDFNDAIFHLRFLFLGENEDMVNTCRDACDSDDSGTDDFTDDINSLEFLFLGQGAIPAPAPLPDETHPCGVDPTEDELTCVSYGGECP